MSHEALHTLQSRITMTTPCITRQSWLLKPYLLGNAQLESSNIASNVKSLTNYHFQMSKSCTFFPTKAIRHMLTGILETLVHRFVALTRAILIRALMKPLEKCSGFKAERSVLRYHEGCKMATLVLIGLVIFLFLLFLLFVRAWFFRSCASLFFLKCMLLLY